MLQIKRIIGAVYFIFNKYITKDLYKMNLGKYFMHGGDTRFLVGHNLDENSLVFDVGGFVGVFSDRIIAKYNPTIYIFEPVKSYFEILQEKYKTNEKVHLFNMGLSNFTTDIEISVLGEKSSTLSEGHKKEKIKLVDIKEFLDKEKIYKDIDLLSMNIEGGEYDLLDRMHNVGLFKKIKTLQVQFHDLVDESSERKKKIINNILRTHEIKYSFPFVWECFERK